MISVSWVGPPASYGIGRDRAPQFVTLHYTAGSEGPTSAEDGARYDKNRTDGTSTHYFVDSDSIVQEVAQTDRAYAAFFHGNEIGIHIELCGTAQTRAQWLDSASLATLKNAAALVADICLARRWPMRRLTVEETRAAYYAPEGQRPTGINDHAAITLAFPEDGGTHMDVGPEFPWDVFMQLVTANESEDDEMKVVRESSDGSVWLVGGLDSVTGKPMRRWIPNQEIWDEMVAIFGPTIEVAQMNADVWLRVDLAHPTTGGVVPATGTLHGTWTFAQD